MNGTVSQRIDPFCSWHDVCALEDIVIDTGMAARVNGRQIALFNTREGLFATGNRDPFSDANVLSRGIVGDLEGRLIVASPVYKQHFCLRTGICLEDTSISIAIWPVSVHEGRVLVADTEPNR